MATVHEIQYPPRNRRSKVAMKRRHCSSFNIAFEARAHDEFGTLAEVLDEGTDLPEVVSTVAVAHDNILATHITERIDIGPSQTSPRRAQDPAAFFDSDPRRIVC